MDSNLNIRLLLINEISLEGLDGITLQALWLRIAEVTKAKLPFSKRLEVDYWRMICQIPEFNFFELEQPRADLVIYDRFVHFDNETESYYEPDEPQLDIYVYKPVIDELNKIRGSCATFFSRKDVSDEARAASYKDVKKNYGSKLVIVANQESREYALIGAQTCQNVDINTVQYCILERIGRSRFHGEITQGKRSLQVLGEDPKSLFYHRKALLKHKLITKQVYHQKCGSQNYSGTLLHLQRYYTEKKPKPLILTEMVVEFLKTKPNYRALYPDITAGLNITANMKKVFKSSEFQRFVRTDVKIPYREYYPNANLTEWKYKNCDKERQVRIMELIDPDVDVAEHWNNLEDQDEEEEGSGYQNYENLSYGVSLLAQAAKIVRGYGVNGLCQSEIGDIMGQNKLSSRSLCRNLLRRNAVTCVMNDVGRQRVTRFVSRKFENKGQMTLQFKQERVRMMSLLTNYNTDSKSEIDLIETKDKINDGNETIIGDESTFDVQESQEPKDNSVKISDEESINSSDSESPKKKLKIDSDQTSKKRRLTEDSVQSEPKKQKIDPIKENRIKSTDLDNIDVKLIVAKTLPGIKGYSQGFTEQLKQEGLNPSTKDGGKVTYRLLRRANFIIECVRQEKVIADLTKLIKMIQEDEHEEGYHAKIDKKSMMRLLLKLAKDGYVKYIKATLTSGDRVKHICFVCDPTITEDHSVIQSALEQAKMKFYIRVPPAVKKAPKPVEEEKIDETFNTDEINEIRKEISQVSTMDDVEYPYDRKATMRYGFSPKFIRMRLIHEFLFYLTYETPGKPITKPEKIKDVIQKFGQPADEELINEMSTVYYDKELNWRMFIPPIPTHVGWPNGWTLICDVLLRLPLSIFVQCFHVPYQIEELYPYLNHPIRKHFLVRHLPAKMRNALMHKRRYIYAMHEIVSRLCFIGLVQFGPQRLKEKDQVFIYLNRKTSLLNTVTSQPGYHEISNIEYEKHMYYFENSYDIDHYWYELWTICINTTLGGRLYVTGKYIVLEQLHTKQTMLDAVLPRLPHDAIEKDTGEVPGDKKGAAGFDSAIFAHLKRNWKWLRGMNLIGATKPPLKPAVTTVKVPSPSVGKVMEMVKKHIVSAGTKTTNKTKTLNSTPLVPPKPEPRVKRYIIKKKPIVRKVLAKRSKRKPFYDEKDKEALLKMDKLRTGWSPIEDHVLLLCTVGTQYLCPNRRRQMVAVAVIRDALHSLVKSAVCKTSRACQRRIIYIMKNTNTRRSVNMCLEEIRQNVTITEKYQDIVKRSHTGYVSEQELNIAFLELVAFMSKMFVNMIQPDKNVKYCLPASISELKENYHIYTTNKKNQTPNKEPQTSHDIQFHVIRTVIHSSMSCTKDKTSWAYQLFKVYQQYPESLLRLVITKTRLEQMISLKKSYVKSHKSGSTIPLSSSPYQLSISYCYQLLSKYPYTLFQETYDMLKSLTNWLNQKGENNDLGFEINNARSGTATALMEMTQKLNITFKFDIPEDVITLDQKVQNDTTYDRILKRFYNILHDPTSFNKWEEKQRIENPDDEENFPDLDLEETQKKPSEIIPTSKSQSRIAFYMMRAEMCEGLDDKSKQHLHDFFVVNGSKVFLNIPSSVQISTNCDVDEIGNNLMFIKADVGKEILNRIKRNSMLPKECPTELEILDSLSNINANKSDIDLAQRIILNCLENGIFGATIQELNALVPKSYEGIMSLIDLLDVLIDIKIIIQSGIETYRYIHYQHKKPWVINTYKILRLDREKLPTIMTSSKEPMNEKLIRLKKHFSSIELQKSKQRLDLTSQQQITVLLSPWLRIDGSLNRRVLDRWLGAVLIACIEQPAISLEALSYKFHYMKPVDVITLVKILAKLECIVQLCVNKPKTSLLSSIPIMTIVPATGMEDSRDILIEPQCNAIAKLALFIGEKSYSTDFFV